jgi:hypothetical protein
MGLIALVLGILFAFFIYFLPSVVGYHKRNASAIIILNLFLGWTLIGWVVALVWASTSDPPAPQVIKYSHRNEPTMNVNSTDSSRLDTLKKLKDLLDRGAITQDEYEAEKGKILRI